MFGLGITRLRRVLLGIAIATVSQTLAVSVNYANAQITPDGTLPNNSSVKLEGNTFNITGGTQAGSNLFHSFGQFSVPTGGTAFFNNAVDIQNIIGRVTGGSISNIDGLIRANGAANLFFLNPSGIVFGPNASLNVGGSFLASTASSLKFADGFEFSATAPQSTPLLTISVPIGLQFGANPGSIQNQSVATNSSGESVGLQVEPGKTLALVGGDVRLDGGLLQAANGRVELAGVASSGTVNLQVNNNNLSLNFPVDIPRADVSLLNAAKVDVTGNGAGTVGITARSIDISGGSKISAGLNKEAGISYVPGNITLNATGVVTIDQLSRITNMNAEGTTANAGNISIQAGDIFVDSRASVPDEKERPTTLDTQSSGQGRGGNVSLSATGKITLIGQDANVLDRVIYTYNEQGLGGGDISLSAGDSISLENAYLQAGGGKANGGSISLFGNNSISIADNSSLISGTVGGNAGDITIKSAGNVSIQNSLLVSGVRGDLTGQAKAGDINISGQSVFVTDGSEFIPSLLSGSGKSGNININAKDTVEISGKDPILSPPRQDRSTTYLYTTLTTQSNKDAYGAAGNININTDKLRVLDGATIAADTKSDFRGGDIMVNAKVVELFDGGQILTTARSRGNAGNIFLKVGDNIVLSGTNPNYADDPPRFNRTVEAVSASSGLFANTEAGSSGNGGEINLTGGSLFLNNNSQITAQSGGTGNAGKINIDASTIEAVSGGKLLTTTSGSGNAGNINVNLSDRFSLSDTGTGLFANTEAGSSGNGGTIEINSTNLSINNGAGIGINSLGQGSAGRFLNINARDEISLANSSITSGLGNQAIGQGGEINLTARSLSLSDGAKVIASTSGQGNAGRINAQVKDRVTLTNNSQIQSTVESTATGNGTQIRISGRSLFLNNNSQITAQSGGTGNAGKINIDASTIEAVSGGKLLTTTSGSGNAGNINVNLSDRFSLSDIGTGLFANTEAGSSGNGGTIEINSTNLSINNGASIGINSLGQGSAGRFLNINARDEISLANSSITSGLGNQAIGQGGEINLTARSLSLSDGAKVIASTSGQGNAGRINAQVKDRVTLTNNSQIQSTVESTATGNGTQISISGRSLFLNNNSQITAQSGGTGNAGNINIDASTIEAVSGGKLLTTTSGSGNAGNISVNVGDRFSLSDTGTGLFANTEVGSSGNGGSIFIDPRTVLIENGAGVTVGSRGTGIGGNIQIQADSLKLDNRAFLSAETASTQGGNIEIQSEGLLLLRRNSLISTNAGNERQGGNGGNITINSPNGFIVAVPNENSDISANAFTGSGGRVNITASGIYGIESRPRPTELSDITASSERGVQGTIDINTPIVDPNRGLLQLSAGVVNTPRLVSSSCAAFDKKGSEFIVTGRGGLPLSPDDFLSSDVIWTDTRLTATTAQNPDRTPAAKLSIPKAVQIVPATGWVFNGKGEVTLISSAPDATASVSPPTCAKQ